MQIPGGDILKVEPDTRDCVTERITSELSICSRTYNECKYDAFAKAQKTPIFSFVTCWYY